MPLHYREIDNDSHVWRIDTDESDVRPSKRRRTNMVERFEKYGIDCDGIPSVNDDWKDSSFSRSSMEEDIDASSSLESSSETMALEDDDHNKTVETILQQHIRANSEIEFLKKGLDKLLALVGAKDENTAAKQSHRAEMLSSGGHWMIANLLTSLTRDYETNNKNKESMNDQDVADNKDDEMVAAVVARSCQILRELLFKNSAGRNNEDAIVRYQIYCAGGLDAVVSALKRFPTSFEVQLAGCQFVSQLVQGTNESTGNPTTSTLIKNLYQSTDQLEVIVRLVGCGTRSSLDDELCLSSTQRWQLLFVVADIVRSVVRQSTLDFSCRSEVIRTVEKYLVCDGNHDDDTMVIDDGSGKGFGKPSGASRGYNGRSSVGSRHHHASGIGKYMYEYLMKIIVDEEDCYETEVSSTFMNE